MNDFDEQPAHKHTAEEEEKKKKRFRGDLDYFRFSSFKSQHHLSNLMLDDFVEICSNKKPTAKTISCCLHYLMRLQSGKWTRKQIIMGGWGGGWGGYLLACRNLRKQSVKLTQEVPWYVLCVLVPL